MEEFGTRIQIPVIKINSGFVVLIWLGLCHCLLGKRDSRLKNSLLLGIDMETLLSSQLEVALQIKGRKSLVFITVVFLERLRGEQPLSLSLGLLKLRR